MGLPRVIATDLDGTLLRSDTTLSEATRVQLRAARAAGIRVVAIAPAATDTPGYRAAPARFSGADAEQAKRLLDDTIAKMALGRLAQADDIARAAVFAASEMAGFITGSTIHVDGGIDAA